MLMNKQKGYAEFILIALMLSVTGLVTAQFFSLLEKHDSRERAIEAGRHLQEYNYGVMRLLSEQGLAVATGTYTGVAWLKSQANCGGTASSTGAYIANCAFPETNSFGDTYTTVITINGNLIEAETRVRFPQYMSARDVDGVKDGDRYLAAVMRSTAANHISDSSPVAQTFAEYVLEKDDLDIIARVSNSPNDDMWLRTDGSNKMNADLNMNNNNLYGVSHIYGAATAVTDRNIIVTVGSSLNVDGVLTIGDDTGAGVGSESYLDILGKDNQGRSIVAVGGLAANFVDSLGDITLGYAGGDSRIEFLNDSNSSNNIGIMGKNADLEITNGAGNATVYADYVYDQNVNRYLDQAVFNITVAQNGDLIRKPTCAVDRTPQIFLSAAGFSAGYLTTGIAALDTYATTSGNYWLVHVKYKTMDSNVAYSGGAYNKVMAIVKCS